MPAESTVMRIVADVKCYYCGHVSGQIIGQRNQRLRVTNFIPRSGYQGPPLMPGDRLRCERCRGPVFLEDAQPAIVPSAVVADLLKRRASAGGKRAA